MHKGLNYIDLTLMEMGVKFTREYRFLPDRKFRFDRYLEITKRDPYGHTYQVKVGIEYEGVFGGRSRHTSVMGYTKDTEKYNLAAINGYLVLRFTAKNYKDFRDYILILLKDKVC